MGKHAPTIIAISNQQSETISKEAFLITLIINSCLNIYNGGELMLKVFYLI